MKIPKPHWGIVFSLIIVILMTSCSPKFSRRTKKESFIIKQASSKNFKIIRTFAYQKDNAFFIAGKVKRLSAAALASSAHIDVTITEPGGKITRKICIPTVPRIIYRKAHREAPFHVRFPAVPPAGSIIYVEYHRLAVSNEDWHCD